MPKRIERKYTNQRGDFTGPEDPEKRNYPEPPQHVPIEEPPSPHTGGNEH
ncbi:hypothetical protein [Bacillus sp. V3-13]|nr:hypothetical protein [Bacillus sp. V3-13]